MPIDDSNQSAFRTEPARNSRSDTARTTRYQRTLAGEASGHDAPCQ
jgi:hypothetical protein